MATKRRKKKRARKKVRVLKRRRGGGYRSATPAETGSALARAHKALTRSIALARSYEEQIDEIGEVLVRHGVISRVAVERDGVRFAVLRRFEPKEEAYLSKRPRP